MEVDQQGIINYKNKLLIKLLIIKIIIKQGDAKVHPVRPAGERQPRHRHLQQHVERAAPHGARGRRRRQARILLPSITLY